MPFPISFYTTSTGGRGGAAFDVQAGAILRPLALALASVIGLYSIHRLGYVEEHGHITDRAVVDVLSSMARRGIRNLSTVAGLRAVTEFPFELLRRALRRDRTKDDDELD